jgi:hypothetical protein
MNQILMREIPGKRNACVLDGPQALQLELPDLLLVLSAVAIGAHQDDRHLGIEAVDLYPMLGSGTL